MKKLLIGAALSALFAVPGLAGEPAKVAEPIKLSSAQMDKVTAGWGDVCTYCTNYAAVYQANVNWSALSYVRQKNDADVDQSIN